MNERWTIEELAPLVEMALDRSGYNGQQSGRVRTLPDLRTIRYYTTLGLLAPPEEMRGRKAFYGRRHLLQLVAIKRLQARRLSLAEVQRTLAGLDDHGLAEVAALPADFWQRAQAPVEKSAEKSADQAGVLKVLRRSFWTAEPAFGTAEPAMPANRPAAEEPVPRLALHLPVAAGAQLVLENVDPARWTPETIARLKGPIEALAQTLRDMKLTS
jgi:DNA-binding transcriptional MerR regulator